MHLCLQEILIFRLPRVPCYIWGERNSAEIFNRMQRTGLELGSLRMSSGRKARCSTRNMMKSPPFVLHCVRVMSLKYGRSLCCVMWSRHTVCLWQRLAAFLLLLPHWDSYASFQEASSHPWDLGKSGAYPTRCVHQPSPSAFSTVWKHTVAQVTSTCFDQAKPFQPHLWLWC